MKKTIKAWLHWDWTNECPIADGFDDEELTVYIDKAIAEEHSALPVIITITEEGMEEILRERKIRSKKSLDE